MTSPTAGIDPQEVIDTRPLLRALDACLQAQPDWAGLPSKFSIGIDGGGRVGIGDRSAIPWEHRYNDIQLTAATPLTPADDPDPGRSPTVIFHLAFAINKQFVAAGVGVAADAVLSALSALVAVYHDYAQTDPYSPPRLRDLLQDWGIDRYLHRVNEWAGRSLWQTQPLLPSPPTQPYAHLGIQPQRQAGRVYVGIHLMLGRLTVAQLLCLSTLAKSFGSGQLRLTPWQTIILPDIPERHLDDLRLNLAELGLPLTENRVSAGITACAGQPGCPASATQTQAHAIALTRHLERHLESAIPLNIHFSGCRKSCAQPSPAEIMLLGTTLVRNGQTLEAYHLYTGQADGGWQPLLDAAIPAAELPLRLERLLRWYQAQRHHPAESLGEFLQRQPSEPVAQLFRVQCLGSSTAIAN
ncbi:MAG: precorrin-3B synthase [Spirulinaceae cyanobacterium RM2_2_10]|nr:precorrin-3B synthase [Spirulinaceae cyanobacterium RM2_2_10]